MKDYEVNYVHQESKTIPDTNYTFETAMMPERLPRHEAPPTHKDVLLKTWAQDAEAMAIFLTMLSQDEDGSFYFKTARTDCGQRIDGYEKTKSLQDAINGWIAYLNSAAEVGE